MAQIIKVATSWVEFRDDVLETISDSVRGNARSAVLRANEILRYCNKNNQSFFDPSSWEDLCNLVNIEKNGLSNSEIEVLNILKERGDCTLTMLSAVTGLSRSTLQRDVESFLLKKNFIRIDVTRKITSKGLNVLASL
jgi:Holliday junction resolvasome RuvABC ATP-dependent DNA helicase subunit